MGTAWRADEKAFSRFARANRSVRSTQVNPPKCANDDTFITILKTQLFGASTFSPALADKQAKC